MYEICSKLTWRHQCEIRSKLTIKTRATPFSSVSIVNFEHVIFGWDNTFSITEYLMQLHNMKQTPTKKHLSGTGKTNLRTIMYRQYLLQIQHNLIATSAKSVIQKLQNIQGCRSIVSLFITLTRGLPAWTTVEGLADKYLFKIINKGCDDFEYV